MSGDADSKIAGRDGWRLVIIPAPGDTFRVATAPEKSYFMGGDFHRDDLLGLIESQMGVRIAPADAIVIERPTIPAVDPERPGFSGYVGVDGDGSAESKPRPLLSAEQHMRIAREHIALAEYAAANPPVDPRQVEAMTTALMRLGVGFPEGKGPGDIARDLTWQGWTNPDVTP